MEKKALQFKLSDVGDSGAITGYGSVFGVKDSYDDIVETGAFEQSLKERTPKLLWQHNSREPIGAWLNIVEDEKGLRVEGKLTMEVTRAREAHALLRDKALDGLSIGFMTRDSSFDEVTGVRTIRQVDLYEISLVTFPANEVARIDAVKAANMTDRELERRLTQDAQLSRSAARALMRGGLAELKAMQDAGGGKSATTDDLRRAVRSIFQP